MSRLKAKFERVRSLHKNVFRLGGEASPLEVKAKLALLLTNTDYMLR
jgi:hypothetical protein